MKKFFLFLLVFFVAVYGAQAENALSVTARAWPKTVTLGGEIRVIIQVTRADGTVVEPLKADTDLSPFEIRSIRPLAVVKERGIVQENFEIIAASFKLGELKVPPIRILYKDPAGNSGMVLTPPIPIYVKSILPAEGGKDAAADIRPIKNVVSLGSALFRTTVLAGLAGVLAAVLAAKVAFRRRKKQTVDPESLLPAHERAALELGRLQKKDLIAAGRTKEHYSELSAILKRYLDRRYEGQTAELTTVETLEFLTGKGTELFARDAAKEILDGSDLVKFANWEPQRVLAQELERRLLDLAERTKPLDVPEKRS